MSGTRSTSWWATPRFESCFPRKGMVLQWFLSGSIGILLVPQRGPLYMENRVWVGLRSWHNGKEWWMRKKWEAKTSLGETCFLVSRKYPWVINLRGRWGRSDKHQWLSHVLEEAKCSCKCLSYIFCSHLPLADRFPQALTETHLSRGYCSSKMWGREYSSKCFRSTKVDSYKHRSSIGVCLSYCHFFQFFHLNRRWESLS